MKISILVTALCFLTIVSPTNAQPKFVIAFNTLVDQAADDYDVYTIGPDGTGAKNITNNKDVAWTYYSWGGRVFFVSDRNACRRCYFLYESDQDGRNIRRISNLQLEDSWMGSRSGGREMVVSGRIGTELRFQLFLIDLSNGRYRRLTDEPKASFRDPTFSADGKRIAYVYKKDRSDRGEIAELYIMNADGSGRRRLTTYPANDPMATVPGYKVGPPHWNSKHNFITYQSEQAGKSSIYAVTPDGKKQWKLTTTDLAEGWHDWSPDGEWLAFDARDPASGRYDIYLMNYQTKEVKKVTASSPLKYHQAPVFITLH